MGHNVNERPLHKAVKLPPQPRLHRLNSDLETLRNTARVPVHATSASPPEAPKALESDRFVSELL